ncbi:cupin domain-containing protein [Variovorax ureilyticus]|uniref:Cupin domain-containing protein n=1 Tax=Variovorax ureilyticus TaxID=1836198 RepID=A0ABU8VRA5_9BURK
MNDFKTSPAINAATLPGDYKPVRRLVTGEDAEGRSYFVFDGPAPNCVVDPGVPKAQVIWATGEAAAKGDDPAPAGQRFGFHSPGGSVFRIAEFPPDAQADREGLARFLDQEGVGDNNQPRHFWFHKTRTLDYAMCLEGEIVALLDKEERVMRPGDVLVQRATNHSWSNRSDKPCRMAFILIGLADGENP